MVSNYAPSITFQQELWKSSTLDAGDHQLLVTNTGNTLIGVDSLVTPNDASNDIRPAGLGPGASSVSSGAILVDDSDPSLNYGGSSWQSTTGGFMQNSSRSTANPGDSCTFTFEGTQVWYFANDYSQNAVVDITLDGNKVYTGASDTSKFVQKLLWSSSQLNAGQHTVKVTHVGNPGDIASVEFFMYLPSASGSKSVPLGAIIGASVGGAVLLTLLGGILVICASRRKRNREIKASQASEPVYEPYPGKEGTVTPGPDHSTLNFRSSILESSGYQSPPPTGAMSARTHLTASGYAGYPEAQA
ncbi:transmembrane protein [Ceratobasidium sp. AG-Ba]|nr:transmembrane protein [Ceratobasidium sp. AG-Ba]